jgi:hypothetical protein
LHYLVTFLANTKHLSIFVSMAYNNKNYFLRVQQVQEVYVQYKNDSNTTRYVYKNYIWPRWNISMSTLYNYLTVNVKKELRQMDMFS